jgi:purine-cytosine permease-like protein
MDTTTEPTSDATDTKTRANLAYLWSGAAIIMLGYILYMWGNRVEILTLIIGLLSGTVLGGIFGVFFAGATSPKKSETTVTQTGDQPVTNVTPPLPPTTTP